MKTNDTLLTIGIIGAAGFILWKMQDAFKGVGSGVGYAVGETGNFVGTTAQGLGNVVNTSEKEIRRTIENVSWITNFVPETIQKIADKTGEVTGQAFDTASMGVSRSMDKYLASQPDVLNPAQGTRKSLTLAASRGKTTVPLITNQGTTQVNVQQALRKTGSPVQVKQLTQTAKQTLLSRVGL